MVVFMVMCGVDIHITHAATGLTIQPIKISQTLDPGKEISGTILLSNAGGDDVLVEINVQDFIPTAGTDTVQFIGRAPGVTTVRDWITINTPSSFIFKKGESKQIPYTIKAPADAEPGSHFGVIFFKASDAANSESQIKVGTQVGVLTFVTVSGLFEQKGVVTDFTVDRFVQSGPVHFKLNFQNTGTVHFEPKGTIDITNMFGKVVGSVPVEGYAVLPTGVKNMGFTWNVLGLLIGKYSAVVSVYDMQGAVISRSATTFYAFPSWYVGGFVATLLAFFFIIRFIKSKIKIKVSFK